MRAGRGAKAGEGPLSARHDRNPLRHLARLPLPNGGAVDLLGIEQPREVGRVEHARHRHYNGTTRDLPDVLTETKQFLQAAAPRGKTALGRRARRGRDRCRPRPRSAAPGHAGRHVAQSPICGARQSGADPGDQAVDLEPSHSVAPNLTDAGTGRHAGHTPPIGGRSRAGRARTSGTQRRRNRSCSSRCPGHEKPDQQTQGGDREATEPPDPESVRREAHPEGSLDAEGDGLLPVRVIVRGQSGNRSQVRLALPRP